MGRLLVAAAGAALQDFMAEEKALKGVKGNGAAAEPCHTLKLRLGLLRFPLGNQQNLQTGEMATQLGHP